MHIKPLLIASAVGAALALWLVAHSVLWVYLLGSGIASLLAAIATALLPPFLLFAWWLDPRRKK